MVIKADTAGVCLPKVAIRKEMITPVKDVLEVTSYSATLQYQLKERENPYRDVGVDLRRRTIEKDKPEDRGWSIGR